MLTCNHHASVKATDSPHILPVAVPCLGEVTTQIINTTITTNKHLAVAGSILLMLANTTALSDGMCPGQLSSRSALARVTCQSC